MDLSAEKKRGVVSGGEEDARGEKWRREVKENREGKIEEKTVGKERSNMNTRKRKKKSKTKEKKTRV